MHNHKVNKSSAKISDDGHDDSDEHEDTDLASSSSPPSRSSLLASQPLQICAPSHLTYILTTQNTDESPPVDFFGKPRDSNFAHLPEIQAEEGDPMISKTRSGHEVDSDGIRKAQTSNKKRKVWPYFKFFAA